MSAGLKELDQVVVSDEDSVWYSRMKEGAQCECMGKGNYFGIEKAREKLGFDIVKEPLHRKGWHDSDFAEEVEGNFCLVRTDHDVVVVPHVGSRFEVTSHSQLLEHIERFIMPEFSDLVYDSVGTLNNGATGFVSLRLGTFGIKGDDSPTVSNLFAYNPLGEGSFKFCGNNVRVVCQNTSNFALREGRGNGSLHHVRHTKNSGQRITEALVNIAEAKMGMQRMTETLDELSHVDVDTAYVDQYLQAMFPMTEPKTIVKTENQYAKHCAVLDLFENDDSMNQSIRRSKYSLYQATTNYVDHGADGDYGAKEVFDGITGGRAAQKDKALAYLCDNVTMEAIA